MEIFNGMIFGSEHGHPDHRISLARNDVDHQPTMYDRIESKCLSILFLRLHQHLQMNGKEKIHNQFWVLQNYFYVKKKNLYECRGTSPAIIIGF